MKSLSITASTSQPNIGHYGYSFSLCSLHCFLFGFLYRFIFSSSIGQGIKYRQMGPKLSAIDMMERVLLSILIGTRRIQKRGERALGGTWRMPPLQDKTRQMTNGGNGYDESVVFPGDGDDWVLCPLLQP